MSRENCRRCGKERPEDYLLQQQPVFGRGVGRRRRGREDQAGAQTLQSAPEGSAPVSEKRGQRQGEGADESAEQSLLQAENQPALGASGHQTVQIGHAPTRLELHLSPETASAGRPVREPLCPPSQSGMKMQFQNKRYDDTKTSCEITHYVNGKPNNSPYRT